VLPRGRSRGAARAAAAATTEPAAAATTEPAAAVEPSVDSKRRAAAEQLDLLQIRLAELRAAYDAEVAEVREAIASVEQDLEYHRSPDPTA
jgi:hypothetical protein